MMSAVMSTLSIISGGRRAHRKLAATSGRKSGQFSDAGEDRGRCGHDLKQQRSASLQTLETSTGGVNLESLEAKMANIEVSLASSRRRSAGAAREHGREVDALRTALKDKDSLIQSLKNQLSASLSAARLAAPLVGAGAGARGEGGAGAGGALSAEERRALAERAAAVRADLDTRRTNIAELRRRLERTHVTDNIDTRIQQAELQYQLGREELELLTLSEQARALHALVEQADAASAERERTTLYSAVHECGGAGVASLVSAEVREGSWGAAPRAGPGLRVEWARDHAAARPGDRVVEVNGVSLLSSRNLDDLQRALNASHAPARLVLLRRHQPAPAQPAPCLTQNEAASLRSELGGLRAAADDAERAKRGLRADNTRLTHRISYLEEQVAELLARHPQPHPTSGNESCVKSTVNKSQKNVTNINITSDPQPRSPRSEVQVFQKGPDITAIVAKLPGLEAGDARLPIVRPRSNASGASPRESPGPHPRSHSSHGLEHRAARMRHSLSHHCISHRGAVDYHAETDAALRLIERNQRHIEKHRLKSERLGGCASDDRFGSDDDVDPRECRSIVDADVGRGEIEKAADRIEESIKKTNWAERKTLSIIEQLKRSQRARKFKRNESAEDVRSESERHHTHRRIDGKVLENAHKSSRRYSKMQCRSAKSSEFESECSDHPDGRRLDDGTDGEARARPTPPRKPLRLSLHRARSAHSLVNGGEGDAFGPRPPSEATCDADGGPGKKPVKRTHGADRWAGPGAGPGAGARATPRPPRRLRGLAPAADAPYPEPAPRAPAADWC